VGTGKLTREPLWGSKVSPRSRRSPFTGEEERGESLRQGEVENDEPCEGHYSLLRIPCSSPDAICNGDCRDRFASCRWRPIVSSTREVAAGQFGVELGAGFFEILALHPFAGGFGIRGQSTPRNGVCELEEIHFFLPFVDQC